MELRPLALRREGASELQFLSGLSTLPRPRRGLSPSYKTLLPDSTKHFQYFVFKQRLLSQLRFS